MQALKFTQPWSYPLTCIKAGQSFKESAKINECCNTQENAPTASWDV